MSEVRNNFIETLDNTHIGIKAQIRQYERMLEMKDPELSRALVCGWATSAHCATAEVQISCIRV
jgi:SUMO ligase MMS21 Smc5/6 complex component